MIKHCVNCNCFEWTNDGWFCNALNNVLQKSTNERFIEPFPIKYDANKCNFYVNNEDYNYDSLYVDFLIEYYELPFEINKQNIILKEIGYY